MSYFRIDGINDKTMKTLRERARRHGWPIAEEVRFILTTAAGMKPASLPPKRKSRFK